MTVPAASPYDRSAYAQPSGKSFLATWLLALLLGWLGIDRFYLGKIGTGILKLVTLGGFGVWTLVDLILTLAGVQRDKLGRPLVGYEEQKKTAWIITIVIWVLGGLSTALQASTIADSLNSNAAGYAVVAPL